MANFRSLPFSIVSLLLLASLIMADGGGGEGQQAEAELLAECRSLDPCRANVSNDACCKEIDDGIRSQGCSCVCKVLLQYEVSALITNCNRYAKCKECPCHNSSKLVCSAIARATIARPL